MNKLYTVGYAHRDALATLDTLVSSGVLIADIRLSRNTQVPNFSGQELATRYKGKYAWVPELGNRNHAIKDADILLKDETRGLEKRLYKAIEMADIALVCGCKWAECCHRLYVSLLLQAKYPELEIEHLLQNGHAGMVKHKATLEMVMCSYVQEGNLCAYFGEYHCNVCDKHVCVMHAQFISTLLTDRKYAYCPVCYGKHLDMMSRY